MGSAAFAISIPTTTSLSPAQIVPANHPAVAKALYRLARPSLLSLCLDWLDERNQTVTAPYLLSEDEEVDEQDLYPPSASLKELQELYTELQAQRGSKRDVVERVMEGDWRTGLTLYQLAMIDMQYLYDHPVSQKWTAMKIVPLSSDFSSSPPPEKAKKAIPRFHPATFLQNLQKEVLPDVKAHFNLDRHSSLPLWILRIYIIDSPYNTSLALSSSATKTLTFDASKTIFVAFPDASPFVYVSLTNSSLEAGKPGSRAESKSLKKLVVEGIPKAMSKPRERYTLEPTNLSARNLDALCRARGGGRTNAASGGWGVYAEDQNEKDNPLNLARSEEEPSPALEEVDRNVTKLPLGMKRKHVDTEDAITHRKKIAQGRFGKSARSDDGNGIERLDIRLEDPYPRRDARAAAEGDDEEEAEEDDEWRPDIRVTFHGTHVFAGLRSLVEEGIIDGTRMPGWMTGEEGVSVGVVRDGRIRGYKGSGL
ncbi:centromere protein Chl4/mis15/CENP-N [Bisporella sp. PMI_857]|nr:centromere protein Chl4/mis15/CENP-N [Bisporella sp. PMI_857]